MTSTDARDPHWGERNVARRTRRLWAIKGAIVAFDILFAFAVLWLMPAGTGMDDKRIMLGIAFLITVVLLGVLGWREADEIQRRLATNMLATVGAVCMLLLPISYTGGRLLHLSNPGGIVLFVAMGLGLVVYGFQRFRG